MRNVMNTIEYIYRFDLRNPAANPIAPKAETARRMVKDCSRLLSPMSQGLPKRRASECVISASG
jgi:carbonic anhydrase